MSTVKQTPKGWPLLEDASYIADIPEYTERLADKLDNGDADVAAAINAANQAKDAAGIAKRASDDLKGKIGALETLGRDTGWIKPPLSPINGFETYGDGLRYRLVGKICQIELPIYRNAGVPNEQLAVFKNLPEEIASLGPVTVIGNTTDATMIGLLNGQTISVGRVAGSGGAWFGLYFVYPVA